MRKPTSALLFGIAFVLAGCASASGGNGGGSQATPAANSSVITEKQLNEFPSATAYDIVDRLHPQWLQDRNQSSFPGNAPTAIQVYLGDSQLGGVDELRNYTGSQLASIRYLDPAHAEMELGSGNTNGAIVLTQR